ncbi:MAG: hypothetical protein AB1690_02515 [Candidatus Zixiibacteriota bacterium]
MSNDLPPELAAIVQRGMNRLDEYIYLPSKFNPEMIKNIEEIFNFAVQEAAQWGRKEENESRKASCKPVELEDCFGSDPNITGGKTVDEFLRDQREETPDENASNH